MVFGFLKRIGHPILVPLLFLALAVLPFFTAASHTPKIFETLQDHYQMIAEHGHSHDMEEDIQWALHGHSHDMIDHDHNQGFLTAQACTEFHDLCRANWRMLSASNVRSRSFLIDRPPRA